MKSIKLNCAIGAFVFTLSFSTSNAQGIYPPQAGEVGSTAIPADSSCFRDWAVSCQAQFGPQRIDEPAGAKAGAGALTYALGKADAPLCLSLGDGGVAILQFSAPIYDGEGFDFAVFENGFIQSGGAFLELAFVEVSSNGVDYFRFPSVSLTDTSQQIESFGLLDASNLNNLAGKYIGGFGTPFDLSDIPDTILLNKQRITHIKVVDCIGNIDSNFAAFDANGNAINDPWPTPFESGGFDLDAVGVINSLIPLGIANPSQMTRKQGAINNFDLLGRMVKNPGEQSNIQFQY